MDSLEQDILLIFLQISSTKSENIHQDSWILDLEDIEKDSGILLRRKKMSESNAKSDKHRFYAGNILYSKLRPYLNKVLIADMGGYCTSEILAFDFGKINPRYALAYLRSPFFVSMLCLMLTVSRCLVLVVSKVTILLCQYLL